MDAELTVGAHLAAAPHPTEGEVRRVLGSPLDPASRNEVPAAVGTYPGAIVMVTHDLGAIEAPRPDRVPLPPESEEDLWSEDYLELVVPA